VEAAREEKRSLFAAVIGCGDVAVTRYLPYLAGKSSFIELVACADIDTERTRRVAELFGLIPRTPGEVLDDPKTEVVLNFTPPLAHKRINGEALRQGKHVYSEKPYGLTYADGKELTLLAGERHRRIASAPDTILGPNIQLARRLIDEGKIGKPVMASISFTTSDRSWHPDPRFFYREGAGPIFDEGPYFLSALVALLGPVRDVVARAETSKREIVISGGPGQGTSFRAEVPTSYVGGLVLHSGVLVSMLMSFDVRGTTLPPLEIYGEEGTLRLKFPGYYNGPIVFGTEHDHISEVIHPTWETATGEARGIGVEEFGHAILAGQPSRLEGDFPLHVLETMELIVTSARKGNVQTLSSTTERPRPYAPSENPRNRIGA
jgi:predicted dehydrogenase